MLLLGQPSIGLEMNAVLKLEKIMDEYFISVLIAVYKGSKPNYLREALISIYKQTYTPFEIVLVIDGPVASSIIEVINEQKKKYPDIPLKTIKLDINSGLSKALNTGLKECQGNWVARMDDDDISNLNRLEKQIDFIKRYKSVDMVCANQIEFSKSPDQIDAIKITPEKHEDIIQGLKTRCVISHPSILLKKEKLLEVGGYSEDVGLMEDWDLYARLSLHGVRFGAIQEGLILVRVLPEQRVRRGGWGYIKNETGVHLKLYRIGFLNFFEAIRNIILYSFFRMAPSKLKAFLYKFVRKKHRIPVFINEQ